MKFCKDCKHGFGFASDYSGHFLPPPPDAPFCNLARSPADPVHGHRAAESCREVRGNETACGADGKWFEERPQKKPWWRL